MWRRSTLLLLALLSQSGCPAPCEDEADCDADGIAAADDCDDRDPDIGGRTAWHLDGDGDGYGAIRSSFACREPEGAVEQTGDCDDFDPAINPSADDIPDNDALRRLRPADTGSRQGELPRIQELSDLLPAHHHPASVPSSAARPKPSRPNWLPK